MKIYKHLNDELSARIDELFPDGTIDIEGDYNNGILLLIEYTDDVKTLSEKVKRYNIEGIGILHPMRSRAEGAKDWDESDQYYISWDSIPNDLLHVDKPWDKCCDALARRMHAMFIVHDRLVVEWDEI